jgi:hypothetical protein
MIVYKNQGNRDEINQVVKLTMLKESYSIKIFEEAIN